MKTPPFWHANTSLLATLFTPLSRLFYFITVLRRRWLTERAKPFKCPVVVIGNISVGGSGKSPMVISLVNHLQHNNFSVGVISRGYGSSNRHNTPHWVQPNDHPCVCGDEPLLIHQQTGAPVVVSPNRVQAVNSLIERYNPNIIVSDDGLQHYALYRDLEVIMLSESSLGNQKLLPAGPLREPLMRLNDADFVIAKDHEPADHAVSSVMKLTLKDAVNLLTHERRPLVNFQNADSIKAIAGIAFPHRFFQQLSEQGLTFESEALPDHEPFTSAHLIGHKSILMTGKDAVKCRPLCAELHLEHCWEVEVDITFSNNILNNIQHHIERLLPTTNR